MKQHVLTFKLFEQGGYPAGAANDPNAPYNQSDPQYDEPIVPSHSELEAIYWDGEHCILQNKQGEIFIYHIDSAERDDYREYAYVEKHAVGRDEDGFADYEYDDDWEVDGGVIERYVNDNIKELSKGEGFDSFEDGDDLVKIDMEIIEDLLGFANSNLELYKEVKEKGKPSPRKRKDGTEYIPFYRQYANPDRLIRKYEHQIENLEKIKEIVQKAGK